MIRQEASAPKHKRGSGRSGTTLSAKMITIAAMTILLAGAWWCLYHNVCAKELSGPSEKMPAQKRRPFTDLQKELSQVTAPVTKITIKPLSQEEEKLISDKYGVKNGVTKAFWNAFTFFPGIPNALWFISWIPCMGHYSNVICKNERVTRKVCALTIDDAPSQDADLFERLLDVLKLHKVRVTFFIAASYVSTRKHEELLKRAIAEGHLLSNHCSEDRSYFWYNAKDFEADLKNCQQTIDRFQTTDTERWFRPPNGQLSGTMTKVLLSQGYKIALGDVWGQDPAISDVEYQANYLVSETRPGSISIIHCPERKKGKLSHRVQTLPILEKALPRLLADGYEFLTLNALDRTQ